MILTVFAFTAVCMVVYAFGLILIAGVSEHGTAGLVPAAQLVIAAAVVLAGVGFIAQGWPLWGLPLS